MSATAGAAATTTTWTATTASAITGARTRATCACAAGAARSPATCTTARSTARWAASVTRATTNAGAGGDARDEWRGGYRGRGPREYRRSDDRIRDDVNDRLTDDDFLDASQIEVGVQ